MNEENVSSSHIKHIPELKPENFEDAYPKILQGFNDIPPGKKEKYISQEYTMEPVDYHSNSADLFMQNDSSYAELNSEKNSKKKIILFNK